MRVAVLGAGAIGAYVGAALARGGTDVHLIARRDNLEAIRANGVKVLSDRGDFEAHPPATDDPYEIGPVDFVFLGLKANSYATCGQLLEPLLGDDTAVIAAQNGIPWWYFHGVDGPYAGRRIETVDPRGAVTKTTLVALVAGLTGPADASGPDVMKWQRRLNALHCDAGPVDGKTGTLDPLGDHPVPVAARHGPDGPFNPATRTPTVRGHGPALRRTTRAGRSGSGRRIVLSQKQNWVWLVGAGNRVLAQGGIVDNPGELHKGSYRTGSYCGRPRGSAGTPAGRCGWTTSCASHPAASASTGSPAPSPTVARSTPTTSSGTNLARRTGASGSRPRWPSGSGTSPRPDRPVRCASVETRSTAS